MNQQPVEGGTQPAPQPEKKEDHSSIGAVIGIIIVIIVLILGGLYFWGAQLNENGYDPSQDQEVQDLQSTSDSDELDAIEADLEEDFATLDKDLQEFDQETNAN